jgi:hypothetical protein
MAVEAPVNDASIPAPYSAGMAERRIDERRRVLVAGKIVWNKGSSVLDCIVRND